MKEYKFAPIESQIEIWKPIFFKGIDYSDFYSASNLGRIKSTTRIVNCKGGTKLHKGIILKESRDKDGYRYITLSKNNIKVNARVHVLIYQAFNGYIKKGHVVNHINNVPFCNQIDNLNQLTVRENTTIHKKRALGNGVTVSKKGYISRITHNKERVYLGYFLDPVHAANAYKSALEIIRRYPNAKAWRIQKIIREFKKQGTLGQPLKNDLIN